MDSFTPANVVCTARDSFGNAIPNAISVPKLNPLGQWAAYMFPIVQGQRGTFDCTSNTLIGAIATRALGTNALSSLPVITPAPSLGQMTSPPPGSTLTGTSVLFSWTPSSVSGLHYGLSVGSSVGGTDIFNSDITSPIATGWGWTVPNLPDDGRTLYVRLSTLSGVRNALVGYNDYTYTASTTLPEITVFPGPTYLYANQLATGVTIPVSWSAPGYSSASLWCCSPGAWQDLDDVPTGSTTISLGQGITYFRLQTPAKDEQGTILVTATTTVLNVPVVGPSLVSSTSPCEGVQWVGEAGRYQMSPSSANVVLWAPLDNVQAGDTIEFFMLDQNFGILMNSTPTTLNVGGPGYCAWWTFQFAGTNLPAQAGLQAAVNINSQSLGVSAIAVGN